MSVSFTAARITNEGGHQFVSSVFPREWLVMYLDDGNDDLYRLDEPPVNPAYRAEANMNLANSSTAILTTLVFNQAGDDRTCGCLPIDEVEHMCRVRLEPLMPVDDASDWVDHELETELARLSRYCERLLRIIELGRELGATHVSWS